MQPAHIPVLLPEVLAALEAKPGEDAVDGTIGAGGHAQAILERTAPEGRLLGLDADPAALALAEGRLQPFGSRVRLVHANFRRMVEVARAEGFASVAHILLDLGLSSMQLQDPTRGFSFAAETLDMRADPTETLTARQLVNDLDEVELANLIYRLGEEHRSRRIARAIVQARPILTARELGEVIQGAVGKHGRLHPATLTFQALRMAVNRELENLQAVLADAPEILAPGGRIAIITFHSLEDRMVKHTLRDDARVRVLTKHPIRPERIAGLENPRARSAKLRVAERI